MTEVLIDEHLTMLAQTICYIYISSKNQNKKVSV